MERTNRKVEYKRNQILETIKFLENSENKSIREFAQNIFDTACTIYAWSVLSEEGKIKKDDFVPFVAKTPMAVKEAVKEMAKDKIGKYTIFVKLPAELSIEFISNEIINRIGLPFHLEIKNGEATTVVSQYDIFRMYESYNNDHVGLAINNYLQNQNMCEVCERLIKSITKEELQIKHLEFFANIIKNKQ